MAPKHVDGDDQLGTPRAQHGGYADPVGARSLRERRKRCEARAPADRNDVARGRIEREADTEGTDDVEMISGCKHIEAARARARDLVEELHLQLPRVRAIDAHGPAQERLLA